MTHDDRAPADAWWAPVETISNSEGGFERVYQGSGLLLSWPIRLAAGERWSTDDQPRRGDDAATSATRPPHDRAGSARRPRPLLPAVAARSVQRDDAARPDGAPAHDWNARISAECYRPNAELGNLGRDLLGSRADAGRLDAEAAIRSPTAGSSTGDRGRNGMAQPFHHTILPLASAADRRTEIRWGLRDFELRFGRRPTGMWLPETAVDLATLRLLADEGVGHTILAPWQVAGGPTIDTRRPVRVDLGRRAVHRRRAVRRPAVGGGLVRARSRRSTRIGSCASGWSRACTSRRPHDAASPLVVIATDGELYGHHQPPPRAIPGPPRRPRRPRRTCRSPRRRWPRRSRGRRRARPSDVASSSSARRGAATTVSRAGAPAVRCVDRRRAGRRPLRSPSSGSPAASTPPRITLARDLPGAPDPWAARDAYVDVVIGRPTAGAFARGVAGRDGARPRGPPRSWRSWRPSAGGWRCSPAAPGSGIARPRSRRPVPLRAAARAARLIDGLAGTDLERRLIADLHLVAAGIGRRATRRRGLRATSCADEPDEPLTCGRPAPERAREIRQPDEPCAPRG